jgi:hypothetical protein
MTFRCAWMPCRRVAPKPSPGWRYWFDQVDQEECGVCPEHDLRSGVQVEMFPSPRGVAL